MAENTPETKEEMEETLEDLQLDPEDLETVAGGTCTTCYSLYEKETSSPAPTDP